MGIPGPQNARGAILYDIVKGGDELQGGHDHRRQRLARPAHAAGRGGRQPRRQPDVLDRRRRVPQDVVRHLRRRGCAQQARAKLKVLEVAGGDSFGGATPPISNFFGDKPTPPIMGMMGIDIDAIGNHSFDRGEAVPAQRADPAGAVPDDLGERRLPERHDAAAVVEVEGPRRRQGHQGRLRRLHDRVDTPNVVFPGNLGPFQVRPIAAGRQRRGREARQQDTT